MKAAREFYELDTARRVAADGRDPVVHRRNRQILELLPSGHRCIDVGCGAGGLAPLLREKFPFIAGVDLSLTLARSAAARGMQASCADLDEGELPYAAETFDAAVCCDVLEHVFDPVVFVRRVVRILKPGAVFAISVPNIRYLPRIWSLVRGYFPKTTGDPHGYDGGHLHYFTTQNIAEIFAAAGLTRVEAFGFNADPSRRAKIVTLGLQVWPLRRVAREFGCSTILVVGRRPGAGSATIRA